MGSWDICILWRGWGLWRVRSRLCTTARLVSIVGTIIEIKVVGKFLRLRSADWVIVAYGCVGLNFKVILLVVVFLILWFFRCLGWSRFDFRSIVVGRKLVSSQEHLRTCERTWFFIEQERYSVFVCGRQMEKWRAWVLDRSDWWRNLGRFLHSLETLV